MALTVADVITNFNTYIGDSSTNRVSAAERLQYVTEGVLWIQEALGNDHQMKTYTLPYYQNVHYYKVTTALASLLEGSDLRRAEKDQTHTMAHKSARELAEEIGDRFPESSWAIELHDGDTYLVVNHRSKYNTNIISGCESFTDGGGTWALDTVNSDATNLTIDTNEFKTGTASFNFDVTVAQSSNNRATIQNTTLSSVDMSSLVDLGAWVFWVYIPDVTNFSSISIFWGSNTTNYWSATVTADINGNAWVNGWNRVCVQWNAATMTLSPNASAITYVRIDYNYTVSQTNDTDFRLDDLTIVRPENLVFYYTSWYVGKDNTGTELVKFGATTDVPYFSGQYDQYKYAVAHKAASLCFYGSLRLQEEAILHEAEARNSLSRQRTMVPNSTTKELHSFKVLGNRFNHRARRVRY